MCVAFSLSLCVVCVGKLLTECPLTTLLAFGFISPSLIDTTLLAIELSQRQSVLFSTEFETSTSVSLTDSYPHFSTFLRLEGLLFRISNALIKHFFLHMLAKKITSTTISSIQYLFITCWTLNCNIYIISKLT